MGFVNFVFCTLVFAVLSTGSIGHAEEKALSKEKWRDLMMKNFPDKLCKQTKADGVTKVNSPAEEDDCSRHITKFTQTCFTEMDTKLPATFDEVSLKKWAPEVATCVSQKVKTDLKQ